MHYNDHIKYSSLFWWLKELCFVGGACLRSCCFQLDEYLITCCLCSLINPVISVQTSHSHLGLQPILSALVLQQYSIMTELRLRFSSKCFDGIQKIYSHYSQITNCEMQFAIYLPLECDRYPLPVLYFLSGLGLDHIDFIEKSAAQKAASQQSVILVAPDSSPRNTNIPNENGQWNFGVKASYYVNATRPPWSNHYRMFSYITEELPKIIDDNFPTLTGERSIMGFSVGGHGAFLSAFKKPNFYRSLSALAPVCDIVKAPHSSHALESYLGPKFESNWDEWSAINLASRYDGPPLHILIDQGSADKYLKAHLFTQEFMEACEKSGIEIDYKLRDGYGHNYYFIKSFIEDHITYHARILHSLSLRSSKF